MEFAVEMQGITKRFGSTVANSDVHLKIRRGEIHAVVGENGAGKSTLMNILYGLIRPDKGIILVNGVRADIRCPSHAMRYGIGMVHQHMMQVPSYSILEDIILGKEPRTWWGALDRRKAEERIRQLSARFGLHADVRTKVRSLSLGIKQRLEIVKLLYRGAEIIILDEPTATLSPQGTEELLEVLRDLNREGKTILFISHKLPEVLAVAHTITVMRKGVAVATLSAASTREEDLVKLMIGDLPVATRQGPTVTGKVVLRVDRLSVRGADGSESVKSVSFGVRAGEIVAIAGVEGNGQSELAACLIGNLPASSGTIHLDGTDITQLPISARRDLGVAFVPEDRIESGLALPASVTENAVLGVHYRRRPISNRWLVNWNAASAFAGGMAKQYKIALPGPPARVPALNLSGGNMQKLLIGREFTSDSKCLVICQPTRGLDVGAKTFVYDALLAKARSGCAVLVISTDLDEVFEIADRILVMYKGELVASLPRHGATPHEVGLYMTGARRCDVAASGGV